jgi:hypothetical protein
MPKPITTALAALFAAEAAAERLVGYNNFARACVNDNTIEELQDGVCADQADADAWGISLDEAQEQASCALNFLIATKAVDDAIAAEENMIDAD